MKAAVVSKYGPPEGVQITDVDNPIPKNNEILIKIHATTVTFGDAMLRRMGRVSRLVMGLFMGGLGKGKILGHEFAGVIEAIGDDVTLFQQGDRVFASAGMKGGAHAEYICLPDAAMIAIKPENLSFEEAAAVPIGANTAYDILRRGNLQKGDRILIYGASGSVGTYAVQLAKHWGAEITAVCSSRNADMVRTLGAHKVIDYTKEDFTEGEETYDLIFDAVRKISTSDCKRILKENGVFLSTGSRTKESVENLDYLKELIESGGMNPVIDRTYSLDKIAEAHRYVDSGRKRGNVAIKIVKE